MSSRNSNLNLASVTSNFDLGFYQFDSIAAQSLRLIQNMNMILLKNVLINFNRITRNHCLYKTTSIFAVAFLLSDSISSYTEAISYDHYLR